MSISVLNDKGKPLPVQLTLIHPPESRTVLLAEEERQHRIKHYHYRVATIMLSTMSLPTKYSKAEPIREKVSRMNRNGSKQSKRQSADKALIKMQQELSAVRSGDRSFAEFWDRCFVVAANKKAV